MDAAPDNADRTADSTDAVGGAGCTCPTWLPVVSDDCPLHGGGRDDVRDGSAGTLGGSLKRVLHTAERAAPAADDPNELVLAREVLRLYGELDEMREALRSAHADTVALRSQVAELLPYLLADVRDGLRPGPPAPDHPSDGCDDCRWYEASLVWRDRLDSGEFGTLPEL